MYAIVKACGRQFKVSEGDVLRVEKQNAEVGQEIQFGDVLLVSGDGGVRIGTPVLDDVKVIARVLGHGKARKILVFKYKPKKNYRRRYGHRQPYTLLRISKIGGVENGSQEGGGQHPEREGQQVPAAGC